MISSLPSLLISEAGDALLFAIGIAAVCVASATRCLRPTLAPAVATASAEQWATLGGPRHAGPTPFFGCLARGRAGLVTMSCGADDLAVVPRDFLEGQ